MARISRLGILLSAGMAVYTAPCYAGFEFTGPKAAPAAAVTMDIPSEDAALATAPMPIAPLPVVTAEPLGAPSSSAMDKATPVSSAPTDTAILPAPATMSPVNPPAKAEPVYIRRQRSTMAIKPPAGEPVDSAALLNATENKMPLAASKAQMDTMPAAPVPSAPVINPYPLDEQATHNGAGKLPLEQAMMEEAGTLRPVATPGGAVSQGMRERAKITSRYDSGSEYLPRQAPSLPQEPQGPSMLTPFPGGEVAPLGKIESVPVAPPVAPMKIAMTPAAPQPAPVSAAPVPRPPSMPRPAVPQNYPAPAAAMPAPNAPLAITPVSQPPQIASPATPAQNPAGGYSEAVGFGRDLPLALALSQVVPPDYAYAFGQNINVGSTVSWQGGKPWDQVLNDMLAPSGMRAVIQDKQITIVKNS